MADYTLNFTVNGGKIEVAERYIAADSVDYIEAEFSFDKSWDELYKTAIFRKDENVYHVLILNDHCTVPFEVITEGTMYVSVFGEFDTTRATTGEVAVQVEKSGYVICEPKAATADPYAYFIEKAFEMKKACETAVTKTEKILSDVEKANSDVQSASFNVIEQKNQAVNAAIAAEAAKTGIEDVQAVVETARDEIKLYSEKTKEYAETVDSTTNSILNDLNDYINKIESSVEKASDLVNKADEARKSVEQALEIADGTNIFANVIKSNVKGTIIAANDVSSVQHNLKVSTDDKTIFTADTVCIEGCGVETPYKMSNEPTGQYDNGVTFCCDVSSRDVVSSEQEADTVLLKMIVYYNTGYAAQYDLITNKNISSGKICCYIPLIDGVEYFDGAVLVATSNLSEGSIELSNIRFVDGRPATIKLTGKNLLNLSNIAGKSVTLNEGTLTCGDDGGITGEGTPTGAVAFSGLPKLYYPNGIYTLSNSGEFKNICCVLYLCDINGKNLHLISSGENKIGGTFNTEDYPDYEYMTVEIKRNNNNIEMSGTAYFQLEANDMATEYEMFKQMQTVTANADGSVEGLTSISPSITLFSDSEDMTIQCEYNVDTKRYIDNKFSEIEQLIISSGGEK